MKRPLLVLSLVALSSFGAGAGAQQPADPLVALARRAHAVAAQGKTDDAIKMLDGSKGAPGVGGRRVRLELGELLLRAGRRADAEPVLLKFAEEYRNDEIKDSDAEGLAMVGRAMHLTRHPKDADRMFKQSEHIDDRRVETLLWYADLLADNYDPGGAQKRLDLVLEGDPHRAEAMVMLARLYLFEAYDFAKAEKLARDALAVDAKNTGSFAVRAGLALRDMDIDRASAALDAGLAIDPNDLELLSIRAAVRFLADDRAGYDAAKQQVFARNKEYSRFFAIVGDFAEWEHRYDDIIAMMKEAVAIDPKDAKAWAQLGMLQTRAGDEQEGVKSMQEAWDHLGDHLNVRAYNTLEILYTRAIPARYESATAGLFDVRYPKREHALLERYVPRMLGEAWGQMKVHYMFAPTAPVHVEMYEKRDEFSIRTSGLPEIGIQGVCFGHVVAAMSPRSEPFNWGNVLWHELAHVFAIQLSKNHVPRWFTEGLSEYETMIRRPEWQRELDADMFVALKKDRLPSAVDMNRAFTHSDGDLDVTVAYYAASQMIAYTAERWGFDGITRALEQWGEGKRTPEVIRDAFGVSTQDYDAGFRAWAKKRLARYEGQYFFDPKVLPLDEARAAAAANAQSAPAHVGLAVALLRAHKADEAAREIDAALKIDPNDADAHYVAALLAGEARDLEAQERHLRAIKAVADGYKVEMSLAKIAKARHDDAAMRVALESARKLDPSQTDALNALFALAVTEKRDEDALAILRQWTQLDQHDRDAWLLYLDRLVVAKRWDEARRAGEAALYVDVESASIHVDYARALAATGDHATAAFELESALLCDARPDDKATAHALLAREQLALGDAAGARAHRDEALKLNPNDADAKALRIP